MKQVTTHYINGQFVDSHGTEVIDLINPADGAVIGRVTLGDAVDAGRAVSAAKEAFGMFSASSPEERVLYLERIHERILAREEEHVAARTLEYGGVSLHNAFSIKGSALLF